MEIDLNATHVLGPTFPQTTSKEGGIHPYSASLHFFQFSLRYWVPQYTNITFQFEIDHDDGTVKHILSHLNTRYGSYIDHYLIFRHGTTTVSITCLSFSYLPLIASYETPQTSVEFQQQNCSLLLESVNCNTSKKRHPIYLVYTQFYPKKTMSLHL